MNLLVFAEWFKKNEKFRRETHSKSFGQYQYSKLNDGEQGLDFYV